MPGTVMNNREYCAAPPLDELTADVHIDFSAIPDSDIEVGCAVLASSIRLALRDPEKRKEYERWKAARLAKADVHPAKTERS